MSTAEISELRRLAELFRTAIEEAKRRPDDRVFFAEHFPRNCCDQASQMIFLFLYERGFRGFRRITANVGEQKHVWLRLNATIIDITADQFAQGTGRAVVADTSDWHSQLKIVSDKNLGMEGDSEASYRDRLLSDVFIPDCYYALRGYVEQIEREKNTINEGDQRLGFNGLSP